MDYDKLDLDFSGDDHGVPVLVVLDPIGDEPDTVMMFDDSDDPFIEDIDLDFAADLEL